MKFYVNDLIVCSRAVLLQRLSVCRVQLWQENYPTAEFSHNISVPVTPSPDTATKTG